MTTFIEPAHAGAFLISEEHGVSRDIIVVASGSGVVAAGTVLGRRIGGAATATGKAGGNTGNGTLTVDGTAPVVANAKIGIYQVRFTSATTFRVTDPKGTLLGDGVTGTAFSDQVKFNATVGGVPFAVGDGFDVAVTSIAAKYVPAPAAATDGSDVAVGVLFDRVDATSSDASGVIVARLAEVRAADLIYDSSVNTAGLVSIKIAQLVAAGLGVRS